MFAENKYFIDVRVFFYASQSLCMTYFQSNNEVSGCPNSPNLIYFFLAQQRIWIYLQSP